MVELLVDGDVADFVESLQSQSVTLRTRVVDGLHSRLFHEGQVRGELAVLLDERVFLLETLLDLSLSLSDFEHIILPSLESLVHSVLLVHDVEELDSHVTGYLLLVLPLQLLQSSLEALLDGAERRDHVGVDELDLQRVHLVRQQLVLPHEEPARYLAPLDLLYYREELPLSLTADTASQVEGSLAPLVEAARNHEPIIRRVDDAPERGVQRRRHGRLAQETLGAHGSTVHTGGLQRVSLQLHLPRLLHLAAHVGRRFRRVVVLKEGLDVTNWLSTRHNLARSHCNHVVPRKSAQVWRLDEVSETVAHRAIAASHLAVPQG